MHEILERLLGRLRDRPLVDVVENMTPLLLDARIFLRMLRILTKGTAAC